MATSSRNVQGNCILSAIVASDHLFSYYQAALEIPYESHHHQLSVCIGFNVLFSVWSSSAGQEQTGCLIGEVLEH